MIQTTQLQKMYTSDRKIRTLLFILIVSFSGEAYSQCCSAGSPVGASSYVGILNKNALVASFTYRYSYLDKYYQGSKPDNGGHSLINTFYNYTDLTLSYGLFKKLTTEVDVGYYIDKVQTLNPIPKFDIPETQKKGSGFSATSVSLKYNLFKTDSSKIEITVASGIKIPFSFQPQYDENNTQLPHEIQPSTGALGVIEQLFLSKGFGKKLKLISFNRFEWNGKTPYNYQFGSFLMNSIFLTDKINSFFSGIIEVRSDFKTPDYNFDDNAKQVNTGSHLIVVSPKLSFTIAHKWHITGLVDIPVYKNYKGTQISSKYSMAINLARDFKTKKDDCCKEKK